MKAGIIAAGDGSRLKSEGLTMPKPLVAVDGVPLIQRLLHSLHGAGITEVFCIVNEYSLAVKEFVESRHFPVPVTFLVKTTPSSMHSLFALSPYFQDDQFLISTVDSIFVQDEFQSFLNAGRQRPELDGLLAVTQFVDDENPLYVQTDPQQRIVSFSRTEHSPWVTGGLYIFSPRIFREIDTVLHQKIERLRNFLTYLVNTGYTLEAYPFSTIIDVDHVQDIRVAERFLHSR